MKCPKCRTELDIITSITTGKEFLFCEKHGWIDKELVKDGDNRTKRNRTP